MTPTFSFHDKVVVVTGGNSGIGLATATQFLLCGAKVAILDIRPSTQDKDEKTDDNRMEIIGDVGDETIAESAIAQVVEKWGKVDILCNVAGIMDKMDRPSECETTRWERCFRVNVNGPFFLTRACTKLWLSTPRSDPTTLRGQIVNVASLAATRGSYAGVAYTASKHALLGLSRSTAFMYVKEGIHCNTVLPGGVQTNIVENSGLSEEAIKTSPGLGALWPLMSMMPGLTEAKDIAHTIMLLASNDALNGAEVSIDKGWSTM